MRMIGCECERPARGAARCSRAVEEFGSPGATTETGAQLPISAASKAYRQSGSPMTKGPFPVAARAQIEPIPTGPSHAAHDRVNLREVRAPVVLTVPRSGFGRQTLKDSSRLRIQRAKSVR